MKGLSLLSVVHQSHFPLSLGSDFCDCSKDLLLYRLCLQRQSQWRIVGVSCPGRLKKLETQRPVSEGSGREGCTCSGRLELFRMGMLPSSFPLYSTHAMSLFVVPPTTGAGPSLWVCWPTCQSPTDTPRTVLY